MFGGIYRGKRVFLTGHTGFKGTWLTRWLKLLGAEVHGYALGEVSVPSMFGVVGKTDSLIDGRGDVRDLNHLREAIAAYRPEMVFHLAAQALVSESYDDPVTTYGTNIMGSVHVLQSLRELDTPCAVVMVTSDKAYENVEWAWGYRETDRLGGRDPYSSSKGAAELAISGMIRSFFPKDGPVRVGIGRAGNVLGGGDWAKDRIVADAVRAWSNGNAVGIRCPEATRPWQHVLEPLSGYLALGAALCRQPDLHGQAFNFGPSSPEDVEVQTLLTDLASAWGWSDPTKSYDVVNQVPFHEAGLLKLSCDKARRVLRWDATLDYEQTVKMIAQWYVAFYSGTEAMDGFTAAQIRTFMHHAQARGLRWAHSPMAINRS